MPFPQTQRSETWKMASDDESVDNLPKKIVFKKREVKGNVRNRKSAEDPVIKREVGEGEELGKGLDVREEDDVVDTNSLEVLRFEQELRRRKAGVDAAPTRGRLNANDDKDKDSKRAKTSGGEAVSAALVKHESEFSRANMQSSSTDFTLACQSSDGIGAAHAHSAIMEAYVQSRLAAIVAESASAGGDGFGAEDHAASAEAVQSATSKDRGQDKVFELPDDLRGGVPHASAQSASLDADVGIYSGIAEVILPASFARKNAQDTERSRRKLEMEGGIRKFDSDGLRVHLGYRDMRGGYNGTSDRFAKPMSHREWQLDEDKRLQRAGGLGVPTVALPGPDGGSGSGSGSGSGGGDSGNRAGGANAGAKRGGATGSGGSGGGAAADKRVMDEYRKRMRR